MSAQRQINLVAGTSFAFFIGWQIISPIFPLYGLHAGASLVEVGFLLSLFSTVTLLMRIPSGTIATRLGIWPIMISSCCLQILSLIVLFLAPSPLWLFVAMIIYGISTGSFGPLAASAALNLATPDRRGEVTGRYYFAIGLALFLGPVLTSILLWLLTFRQLFLAILFFPLSALIASTALRSGINPRMSGHGVLNPQRETTRQLFALLKKRRIVVLLAVTVLFFSCEGFFSTLFPVYGQEVLHLSPSAISILFAFFGGVNASSRIPVGRLSDDIGRKAPLLLAYGLSAFAFIVLARATRFPFLALGMVIYGVAWGMRVPPSSALLADSLAPHELPVAMACLWMAADLGFSIGAAFAGPFGSITSLSTILYWAAFINVASMLLIQAGLRDAT